MCEPMLATIESEPKTAAKSIKKYQPLAVPLTAESCRNPHSELTEFANQIQFDIKQRAQEKLNKKRANSLKWDCNTKHKLQRLPNYHSEEFQKHCESENVFEKRTDFDDTLSECEELLDASNKFDYYRDYTKPHYVTFRINKHPLQDPCDPIVVNETYPELAAYIRQILEGNSVRNAMYGIKFEPCSPPATMTKKNPYEILIPTVIENLLNKLVSSSSLSPIEMQTFSCFLNVASRLGIKDLDAYFQLLRMRGVVLADVVDSFQKQFLKLKTVYMSTKKLKKFLKTIKNSALFGDPLEKQERKMQTAKEFAKTLETSLKQAEQWAKDFISKKLKRSSFKDSTGQFTIIDNKTETKPLVPILLKANATPSQREVAKTASGKKDLTTEHLAGAGTGGTGAVHGIGAGAEAGAGAGSGANVGKGKGSTIPKPLVIRRDTDPKFQSKTDEYAKDSASVKYEQDKHEGTAAKKGGAGKRSSIKETKDSGIKKELQLKKEQASALDSFAKKDEISPLSTQGESLLKKGETGSSKTQEDSTKKHETLTGESSKKSENQIPTKKDETSPGETLSKKDESQSWKKDETVKQESSIKKDEASTLKTQGKLEPTTQVLTSQVTTAKTEELIMKKTQNQKDPTSREISPDPSKKSDTTAARKDITTMQQANIKKDGTATMQQANIKKDGTAAPNWASLQTYSQRIMQKDSSPEAFLNEDDKKMTRSREDSVFNKRESLTKLNVDGPQDLFKTERHDSLNLDIPDKISAKSMRMLPERDFRLRLAAAMSAAQKYADKLLLIPDGGYGYDDTHKGTKRFTTGDILLETDGKNALKGVPSKIYNDQWQLLARYSFEHSGAHHTGYYEPWDVEFPWPDIQQLVEFMARFYVKRVPDPNFSFRRGMEYYQAVFRRELEDAESNLESQPISDKAKKSKKLKK